MPNKHQIQKDFYTKQREWREKYKVGTNEEENLQKEDTALLKEVKENSTGDREI